MLYWLFLASCAIAIASALMAITRLNASHALIYLVITLLSLAVIFFLLGAPFAAALQIVIYAGAIVVLFLFVVMMLNLGRRSVERERQWLLPGIWVIPSILAGALFVILGIALIGAENQAMIDGEMIGPRRVGAALVGPYVLAVELAGVLLLAGLVGAYHLGRRYLDERRES